eukprot:1149062-Pelagomonas_calceolata.AAC.10
MAPGGSTLGMEAFGGSKCRAAQQVLLLVVVVSTSKLGENPASTPALLPDLKHACHMPDGEIMSCRSDFLESAICNMPWHPPACKTGNINDAHLS